MKSFFVVFLFGVLIVKQDCNAQYEPTDHIVSNKKKTKSWLVDADGKKISAPYFSLQPLRSGEDLGTSLAENTFFEYSSDMFSGKVGIIRGDGKVITPDTLTGYFTTIKHALFCLIRENNAVVIDGEGTVLVAYSENLRFYEEGVMIKEKGGLFAAFNRDNVQLTDFIYSDFDTGNFIDQSPPVLVYMKTADGVIHAIGIDGQLIQD